MVLSVFSCISPHLHADQMLVKVFKINLCRLLMTHDNNINNVVIVIFLFSCFYLSNNSAARVKRGLMCSF